MNLRVLIVDDTIVYRKIVSDALSTIPEIEVVGTANNGKIALSRIKALKPDLITLDIEMPEMNGLEVLETIKRESLDVGVIVLSHLTLKGGDLTIKALELGAFDFITKPEGASMAENMESIKKSLAPLLKAYTDQKEIKSILKGVQVSPSTLGNPQRVGMVDMESTVQRMRSIAGRLKSEVIGIGISTGGPNALNEMLPRIKEDINVPILIVQHMPHTFTQSLARSLDARCSIKVKEAENGEPVEPNIAYIAPGGKQMKVVPDVDSAKKIIRITNDPPENNCKPSADYLFKSIAYHYSGQATGVIMTGMGNDGVLGLKLMKRSGAVVIAQDEATSVVFGMPKEAIEAGIVDIIAPLDKIADEIIKTAKWS